MTTDVKQTVRTVAMVLLSACLAFLFTINIGWLASSCTAFSRNAEGKLEVDLAALADDIQFYRESATALAPTGTPELQAKLKELSLKVIELESALRAAAVGGPLSDVKTYANATLTLAEQSIAMLQASGKNTGNASFWIGVVRVGMLAIERGAKIAEAREEMRAVAAAGSVPPPQ